MATKFVENEEVAVDVTFRHVNNTKKKCFDKFHANRTRNGEIMAWRQNFSKTRWWRWMSPCDMSITPKRSVLPNFMQIGREMTKIWHGDEICRTQEGGGGWDLATCQQHQKEVFCQISCKSDEKWRNYDMATKFVENEEVAMSVTLRRVDNTKKKSLLKFDGNRTKDGEVMAWRRNLAKTRWWR
ncbi:hypothetical protein Fcan01_28231 [Folsomia candida]|uniref:Uncharacterized protein n=1 Tax=Folsomia candida TaxID=158441 RepID=A0A226CVR4_FOLCA|nr:hypothetical protein Fcan01_28231 [Folsomia candida]